MAAAHGYELQLLDLPTIRCALGVLQAEFGYDWSSEGRLIKIFVESEDSQLPSLQAMWLRYALHVPKEAGKHDSCCECGKLRALSPHRRADPTFRRRGILEVSRL